MSRHAMTRYVFEEVTVRWPKSVACSECGKKVRRSKTFMNTLNPFNVDPETGEPRTRTQILVKLRAEAQAWAALPERCTACLRIVRR